MAWDLWVHRYGALCDCNSDCKVSFTLIFIGFNKTTLFGCLYCTLKGPTGMPGERGRIGPTGPVVSDYFWQILLWWYNIYLISKSKWFLFVGKAWSFRKRGKTRFIGMWIRVTTPSLLIYLPRSHQTFTSDEIPWKRFRDCINAFEKGL